MSRPKDNISRIELIAAGLQDLEDDVIFIGGACIQFYVPFPDLMDFRSTEDVDCIVKITTSQERNRMEENLRRLGFANDMTGGPVVRWIYHGLKVDIIPDECSLVGYRDIPWFRDGRNAALKKVLASGRTIRILTLPYYLASKLEASKDRGGGNYLNDHDLEDVVCIIDGNENLSEIQYAPEAVRGFLKAEFSRLLSDPDFIDSIPGHIGFNVEASIRARDVETKMRKLI
jgi:hypothetical protein